MSDFSRLPHLRWPLLFCRLLLVCRAEAAKSCFRVVFAALDLGEFLRVFVRGRKILLPSRVCCLWTWGASSGLRQRQQNPSSEACLLPLDLGSFFGSSSEAAKSCFRVVFAAFGLGELRWVNGRSSKNPFPEGMWLPWAHVGSGLPNLRANISNLCLLTLARYCKLSLRLVCVKRSSKRIIRESRLLFIA